MTSQSLNDWKHHLIKWWATADWMKKCVMLVELECEYNNSFYECNLYEVGLRYLEHWYFVYNGYIKVIGKSQTLIFEVFHPWYLEFLDISKLLNSPNEFKKMKFDCIYCMIFDLFPFSDTNLPHCPLHLTSWTSSSFLKRKLQNCTDLIKFENTSFLNLTTFLQYF